MIIFLGDSFTWGQGLHYYYKIENGEWTWDDCRTFLEKNNRFEGLGFGADEYRRSHSFPYLVGKELNMPIITPQFENGGDNYRIYDIIDNLELFISQGQSEFIIIQFSAPTRVGYERYSHIEHNKVEDLIKYQIDRINSVCGKKQLNWFGISWFKEMGEILQKNYPKQHIPVIYNNKEYESFDFMQHLELRDLTIQFTENIDDGHFNKKGHQVIANSILHKLNNYERENN